MSAPDPESTDADFVAAFEGGTLEAFPHRAHVRLAWIYLGQMPLADAVAHFAAGLRRFAAARGASGLYHETITWAYLLWIHECRRRRPCASFDAFASAHPELLEPGGLARFYRAVTLASAEARASFVLPDRIGGTSGDADPMRGSLR